ncbi:MAG: hypothetical protein GEU99_21425 [Luteitalea sp.]|nr:hypothetical protein [Luteitalea sp.]
MSGHIASPIERARRLKHELERARLSASRLERISQQPPFDRSRFHTVPHALHSMVRDGFQPHPFQLATLSSETGMSLDDWLSLFGYLPELVSHWQLRLHVARTVPISSALYSPDLQRLWAAVDRLAAPDRSAPIVDLDALPEVSSMLPSADTYVYLKLGRDDRIVPSLFPAGSIVRVDTTQTLAGQRRASDIFAVEHLYGISVCPVASGGRHVQLIGRTPPRFRWRLELGTEAIVLGRVDRVLRPVHGAQPARLLRFPPRRQPLVSLLDTDVPLHVYVAAARERVGLSFPEAVRFARRMAAACGPEYALASGTLARYETLDRIPRHIPKLFTLASVYALDLWRYLSVAGMLMPLTLRTLEGSDMSSSIAVMLRDGLRAALNRPEISDGDTYWFGGLDQSWHPLIKPGVSILVVDRRQQQPRRTLRLEPGESHLPLFLIQAPDGRFDAGPCSVEGNELVFHPIPPVLDSGRRVNAADASVVGRIVAVLNVPRPRASSSP